MKIDRVEINCSDKLKFAQIAFLVDRDDFRSDVFSLRQKWLKEVDPFSAKDGDEWYSNFLDKTIVHNDDKKDLKRLDSLKNEIFNEYAKGVTDEEAKQQAKLAHIRMEDFENKNEYFNFENDIKNLLIKYHLPMVFYMATLSVVTSGKVNEELWTNCRASLESAYRRDPDIGEVLKEPCCVFLVTPYATLNDIKDLFKRSKEKINNLYQDSEYDVMKYVGDTVSTIKTSRIWYWNHLSKDNRGEGKSYLEIAKKIKDRTELYQSRDRVRKAIKAYCKNLSKPLRKLDNPQTSMETL